MDNQAPALQLTVDRIFNSKDFDEESPGTFLWRTRCTGYFRLAPPDGNGPGKDSVRYDTVE